MFVFVHMCACEYDLNNDVSGNKHKSMKNFIIIYF